jgi:peptidyl-prolyl cis-trans isomerase D
MLKYLRMGNKRTKTIWWVLILVTVVTFLGGFIFLFGAGFDRSVQAQATGALGTVDGEPITRTDYQNAITEQRELYKRQYGSDPVDQDAHMVEAQAWRGLVTQALLRREAEEIGLKAYDREVVLQLQTSPPSIVSQIPDFQTDGKFDPEKYQAALKNPNNNWAPFEELVRLQLPIRKLQERLLASIKLSQPELQQAFRDRFERIGMTLVLVPPSQEGNVKPASDADLDRVFAKYKGRFDAPARMELELLQVPRKFTPEELRVAREQANSLVERARRGEDFAVLARDYSEGAGAERGGEINRVFQPGEFGPQLAPQMAAMKPGDISAPVEDNGRFMIFKLIDRVPDPVSQMPSLRVAQIVIKAKPGTENAEQQRDQLGKIRERAKRVGLGKAASENGLATAKTPYFDLTNAPPQLVTVPEAIDWAIGAKPQAISPVFESAEGFTVVQLTNRREAGSPPKADVLDQLRQIAEYEQRTAAAKPKADQIARAVASGQTLEAAASAAGLPAATIEGMSRAQPDPRVAAVPEVVGAAFAAAPGRVVGPIESPAGWYFFRVDRRDAPDSLSYEQLKGQITTDILNRKQREFFTSWLSERRMEAEVEDLRAGQP